MNFERFGKTWDFLRRRRQNYQLAFFSPAGNEVLMDLARFCRANETCFHEDPRLHAVLEGRREVWLRIQQHLHLSSEDLMKLYGGNQVRIVQQEDEE
jgi:hypothetical protein